MYEFTTSQCNITVNYNKHFYYYTWGNCHIEESDEQKKLWFIIGRLKQKFKALEYYYGNHTIYCSNWENFECIDNCSGTFGISQDYLGQMKTQDCSNHD